MKRTKLLTLDDRVFKSNRERKEKDKNIIYCKYCRKACDGVAKLNMHLHHRLIRGKDSHPNFKKITTTQLQEVIKKLQNIMAILE